MGLNLSNSLEWFRPILCYSKKWVCRDSHLFSWGSIFTFCVMSTFLLGSREHLCIIYSIYKHTALSENWHLKHSVTTVGETDCVSTSVNADTLIQTHITHNNVCYFHRYFIIDNVITPVFCVMSHVTIFNSLYEYNFNAIFPNCFLWFTPCYFKAHRIIFYEMRKN